MQSSVQEPPRPFLSRTFSSLSCHDTRSKPCVMSKMYEIGKKITAKETSF